MKDPSKPGLPPGGGTKLTLAATLLVGGIALAVFSFIKRGEAVNHSAAVAVTIVGVVLPLLFIAAAYGLLRMVYPPAAKHLRLAVELAEVARGDEVVVRLEVTRPEKASDRLEVGLVCTEFYDERRTDGSGGTTRVTEQVVAFEDWRPHPGGPVHSVRFSVPEDAPFSYRGDCLSYVWRVSAREPRRLRFDPTVNVPLVVRP